MDSLRSTFNYQGKHCFLNSKAIHVTTFRRILPYSSSYKEHLIIDIRSNIPNVHTNINIPNIDFAIHAQISTNSIGSYIVCAYERMRVRMRMRVRLRLRVRMGVLVDVRFRVH
jgi:hypothetical protein